MSKLKKMKIISRMIIMLIEFVLIFSNSNVSKVEVMAKNKEGLHFDIKQGDVITLGTYEQDNNLENGTEPIEWVVLNVEKNYYKYY